MNTHRLASGWTPRLFPCTDGDSSKTTGDGGGTSPRPFGLTRTVEVHDSRLNTPGELDYDPRRQVSVAPGGENSERLALRAVTHQDTRYDSQWFVDKD
ncbi:putative ATP-grasp target RiPP [Actinopolyspora alba]|uniref:Putative ATP-grasp target RiPP n=1 Tax=Actinopolyspora alba TaxID=673379 RepID=A0A1I1ZN41_9ACTN|nr:hypothetical protein [Actinopolyspora alba]SFE33052.1 putative ATP-grasp target RiPP [Actinopolyspora alba]